MGLVMRSTRVERAEIYGLLRQGFSVKQVAARSGWSPQFVSKLNVQVGGVLPRAAREPSGRFLCREERYELARLREDRVPMTRIAQSLGRDRAGLYRELKRNTNPRTGRYEPEYAQSCADRRVVRPQRTKLARNQRLRQWVQAGLAAGWTPEEVAGRCRVDFPDDPSMRICTESIYQSIYIRPRNDLRVQLAADLRRGRVSRRPRRARGASGRGKIIGAVSIADRPEEVLGRRVPGHHEGDLLKGSVASKSAVATVVERVSGYLTLIGLPNGFASVEVVTAIETRMSTYPEFFRKTITWDRGTEMARHADLTANTGIEVYFADPYSPWQRGSNENINGLLRQYLPKGADLSTYTDDDLARIESLLNNRPRKRLGFHTPAEVYAKLITEDLDTGV